MARVGLHLGPFYVSGRLGGRSERDREADAALLAGLLIVAVVVSFFGFAPWAAVQAVSGRWGVTATVLGVLFIAASLGSLLWPSYGVLFGTSWGLYCTYLVGYWTLAGHLTAWLLDGQPQVNSLDDYVLGLLTIMGIVVEGVALLGVAIVSSYVLALGRLDGLQGPRPRHALDAPPVVGGAYREFAGTSAAESPGSAAFEARFRRAPGMPPVSVWDIADRPGHTLRNWTPVGGARIQRHVEALGSVLAPGSGRRWTPRLGWGVQPRHLHARP